MQKSLKSFCEDVSDNAFEECDVVFGAAIEAAADGIYSLCTDDFSYTRTNADGTSTIVSLSTIMNDVAVDEDLKTSLFELIDRIDNETFFAYYVASEIIPDQNYLLDIPYGTLGNAADNSCGAVALHNAYELLGLDSNFNEIFGILGNPVHDYGTNADGILGTNPSAINLLLEMSGVDSSFYLGKPDTTNLANDEVAIVLYLWNNSLFSKGAHYQTYTLNAKGEYVTYNPDGIYKSYKDMLEGESMDQVWCTWVIKN